MSVAAEIPAAIEDVTVDQPAARMALAAAAAEPFHAYLLAGPPGSGKAPPPGRLPPSCSPTARPIPTTPGAARSPTPRRTPTWSGCARPGSSTWSRTCAGW